MILRRVVLAWVALVVIVAPLGLGVGAVIIRLTPLQDFLQSSTAIALAEVESVDPARPSLQITIKEVLKGKTALRTLPVLIKGDAGALKNKEPAALLERVAPKVPLVLFLEQKGADWTTYAYTNGTWFQCVGQEVDGSVRWQFTHLEPFLRRTFQGSTAELTTVIREVLAGKRKAPPADTKAKPGIGPPLKKANATPAPGLPARSLAFSANTESEELDVPVIGVVRSVVPTVFVGGPLALLAMLFPTLFGGWKRWLALLSTVGTSSTLLFLHFYFAPGLAQSFWTSKWVLWQGVTLFTLLGALWAWSRHLLRLERGEALPSGRVEGILLVVLSLVALGVIGAGVYLKQPLFTEPLWMLVVTLCLGVWFATLLLFLGQGSASGRSPLATEARILSVMSLTSVVLLAFVPPQVVNLSNLAEEGEAQSALLDDLPVHWGEVVWQHDFKERAQVESTPLVSPESDRLYLAVAYPDLFRADRSLGILHAFDLKTRKEIANSRGKINSSANKNMRPISISSPWLADGHLYIGEGYHEDADCNLYCLNANTLAEKWAFPTSSHTESSPCVAHGRVFFGAGDDGIFAVDVLKGKKVWNYPEVHVDASPLVVGGRLYVGSGVGDRYKETVLLCLDAQAPTAKVIWRKSISHPAWGSPVEADGLIYFGIGNGNFNGPADTEPPFGMVLCVQADTGEEVWRYEVGDGVLGRPTLDRTRIYFGSRDRYVYCLDRKTGKLAWKQNLQAPVLGSVVLARTGSAQITTGVYAVSQIGTVACFGPQSGRVLWSHQLGAKIGGVTVRSTPALKIEPDGQGETRRLFVPAVLGDNTPGGVLLFELADRLGEKNGMTR